MAGRGAVRAALLSIGVVACGGGDDQGSTPPDVVARGVPQAQSAAAAALRLPVMHPSPGRIARAGDRSLTIDLQLRVAGAQRGDTVHAVPADLVPSCGAAVVDSAPALASGIVTQAIVWVEGPATTFVTAPSPDRRPTVQVSGCRLQPAVQVAAPGSAVLLVMRDSFPESLVLVPSSMARPVDTLAFSMPGQLVPMQRVADSSGVVAIYSTRLPWSRAFLAIAPTSSAGMPDRDGRVRFSVDARARFVRVRAWHPVLGSASLEVPIRNGAAPPPLTLTLRR